MRIVSLLPSATEIICSLGLRDQLVAVSHECDFPSDVARLPRATSTRIEVSRTSAAIDAQVRRELENRNALYDLNTELLHQLQPDLLVTQALCDVCAVSAEEVDALACELSVPAQVINLEPFSLEEVFDTVHRIASACDVAARADRLIATCRRRIDAVRARVAGIEHRPKVAFLEWLVPPFNGGHWNSELIELAGGIDVLQGAGGASRSMDWESIARADPDVLFIACCGYSAARARQDLELLSESQTFRNLRCVQQGRVYYADGNQLFNRPGPRLVESLEVLAAALHPDERWEIPGIYAARHLETGRQTGKQIPEAVESGLS